MKPLKIAVTGPEGSGKTILATTLANYFQCPVVRDYSDYYLNRHEEEEITPEILLAIAKGKINWENEALKNSPRSKIIIADGDLFMLKVWSEFKFNNCPENLKDLICKTLYDLYILTKPEKSPKYPFKREEQSLRMYFFNAFKKEFDEKNLSYTIVEGDFYSRKKQAVDRIQNLLESYSH